MPLLFFNFTKNRTDSKNVSHWIAPYRLFGALLTFLCGVILSFEPVLAGNGRDKSIVPRDKSNPLSNVWSGYYYSSKELQALQMNGLENPGLKFVKRGAALWRQTVGEKNKSCAQCHGKAPLSMGEAGARYPVYHAPLKRMINLEQRINLCRTDFQAAKKLEYESDDLLALSSFVRAQAKFRPVRVKVDGFARDFFEKGRAFYYQRRGQLDMSCANCHETNYGKQLRSTLLSQGQANGFPAYRVGWQKLGSLHRQFQGCNKLVRAKPYSLGAEAYVNLELYLNWRGSGLEVETPGVRE